MREIWFDKKNCGKLIIKFFADKVMKFNQSSDAVDDLVAVVFVDLFSTFLTSGFFASAFLTSGFLS